MLLRANNLMELEHKNKKLQCQELFVLLSPKAGENGLHTLYFVPILFETVSSILFEMFTRSLYMQKVVSLFISYQKWGNRKISFLLELPTPISSGQHHHLDQPTYVFTVNLFWWPHKTLCKKKKKISVA